MAKEKSKQAKGASEQAVAGAPAPRMRDRYREQVVASLMKEFGYANVMQVPRVVKITINAGLGEAVGNPNVIKTATDEITAIAGQQAVVTRAKKSIANFKLREDVPIGCMVTLRRERMWEFLDRLLNVAMPRIRDFKGVSPKGFDGHGSYTLGLKEQTMFIEVIYDKVERQTGMNVSIVTTAKTDDEGRALLRHLGMPFRN